MSDSAILKASRRSALGTRACRKLRAEGLVPGNLQGLEGKEHIDISVDLHEFMSLRRKHTLLFDIDIEGEQDAAMVQELVWDTFGNQLLHVEFKRVVRGVEIESEIELHFIGHPKGGQPNVVQNTLLIKSIPSKVPEFIEVILDGVENNTTIHAEDLKLPEGVTLVSDENPTIVVIRDAKEEVEETEEDDEDEGILGAEPTEES